MLNGYSDIKGYFVHIVHAFFLLDWISTLHSKVGSNGREIETPQTLALGHKNKNDVIESH